MTKKQALPLFIWFILNQIFAQNKPFNLGFENIDTANFPMGWLKEKSNNTNFTSNIDSIVKKEGKYALRMTNLENEKNSIKFEFLNRFVDYHSIVLHGFIKTEKVSKIGNYGFYFGAKTKKGSWIILDSTKINTNETTDWQAFSIKLPLNFIILKGDKLVIECFSTTIGSVWFDDLQLFLDDIPIDKAPLKKFYKAQLDTSFNSGSKINITSLTKFQTHDLALLGKIWGFLKYHHPKVAAGDFNWDFELFHIMPKILAATHESTRDKILIDWIDGLGTVLSVKQFNCESNSDDKQKPDFSWINTKEMSGNLVYKLMFIQKNRSGADNYYVTAWEDEAPPNFTNEYTYNTSVYPDVGFRLLSLYRFWNIIQYYYPYKYAITEESWDAVLEKLIPIFIEAKNDQEYRSALLLMLQSIHDSHASFYKDPVGNEYKFKPSVRLQFVDEKAVVSSVSNESSSLKMGDILLEKNGEKMGNIVQKMLPFTSGSNKSSQMRGIANEILRTNDTTLRLKVLRNDSVFNVIESTSYFYNIFTKPKSDFYLIKNNVGYIYLGSIKAKQFPTIFEEFKQTKGIILDLRNYPQLLTDEQLKFGEYLMPKPIPFVKFSNTQVGCPGKYRFEKPLKVGIERTDYYKGKIVILVNENTISRAELFAMLLKQAPKAIIMGSQTAGADGSIVNFPLLGGFEVVITGKGTYYPDGKETQRIGIVPDIEVKPTIKGIKDGRDEVLDRAIEYISKN
jgi:C-terminal processing protease CtpA/Prc